MSTIAIRTAAVQARIAAAAGHAGRPPGEITLIAVTKTWPVETLLEAYRCGLRHFGENRAEELAEKRSALGEILGDDNGIVWHQIGTLQSRKTALAANHADMFHAADRLKVITRLADQCAAAGRRLPLFVQVNVSGEESKSGVAATRWERDKAEWEQIKRIVAAIADRPVLELRGLMTIAPWNAPPATLRTLFRQTRLLRDALREAFPALPLADLSMGMTDDFEIAIEEGATYVRVGRAIFGSRR